MDQKVEKILNDIQFHMSLKDDMAEAKQIIADISEKLGPINQRLDKLEIANEKCGAKWTKSETKT